MCLSRCGRSTATCLQVAGVYAERLYLHARARVCVCLDTCVRLEVCGRVNVRVRAWARMFVCVLVCVLCLLLSLSVRLYVNYMFS